MKRGKRKIQILSLFMAVSMVFLSACGSEEKQTEEAAEVIADSDIADIEDEAPETVEVQGEEERKEEEAEEIEEEPLAVLVPYSEENELEFCEDLTIPVESVRIDINETSVYEEVDAECIITDVSIEELEDGTRSITIKYEVTGEVYDDREKRLLQAVMPQAAYCDLNTGEFYPVGSETFWDNGKEIDYAVEWDGETYNIIQTKTIEWTSGLDWIPDGKSGYVKPVTMYATNNFIIPKDYNSMGMIIGMFTAEETYSGDYEMFKDNPPFILEVLENRDGARLYSINELCKLFSEDETVADDANTNNCSSKDSTTSKQDQPAHTHSYTSSVTKNPTCSENGEKTFVCSCGSSYKEAIPSSGHSWVTTTETVSHPSTGHYETVTETTYSCMNMNVCGYNRYGTWEEFEAHCKASEEAWNEAHADFEWNGSSEQVLDELSTLCTTDGFIQLKETKEAWIVDSDAYEETVTVTKCAICGKQG